MATGSDSGFSSSSGGSSSNFVGISREVTSDGVFGFPIENFAFTLPSNVKDVFDNALYYAFYNCTSLTSVDLSNLSTISGNNALYFAFSIALSVLSANFFISSNTSAMLFSLSL